VNERVVLFNVDEVLAFVNEARVGGVKDPHSPGGYADNSDIGAVMNERAGK